MTDQVTRKLNLSKKLLLGAAGVLAVALPIVFGLLNATPGHAQSGAETTTANAGQPGHPVHVRKDIMQGLILTKVPPVYPDAARKAGIQGKVILDTTISKTGDVENIQLVSGHPLLFPSAIDAVKQWKYKPYILNGSPVEVLTQVNVDYKLAK